MNINVLRIKLSVIISVILCFFIFIAGQACCCNCNFTIYSCNFNHVLSLVIKIVFQMYAVCPRESITTQEATLKDQHGVTAWAI